jgi:hypothetical protein
MCVWCWRLLVGKSISRKNVMQVASAAL